MPDSSIEDSKSEGLAPRAAKPLLLLSTTTGYQARMFCQAAERMGAPLVLVSDRCHMLEDPWRDGAIAVRFEEPEEAAMRIVEVGREQPISGLAAVGDQPTLTASLAARHLGITHHPPSAVLACRNKHQARDLYRAAGLLVPWYDCLRA